MCANTVEETDVNNARGKALVQVLAFVLDKMVSANAHRVQDGAAITKFHALRQPSIGIEAYLLRIFKYASCSPECFVLALIYIDRLIQRNDFFLSSLNVHRVVITSVVLAAKFFDDQYFNNAYYAKVGGIPCVEMNSLELEFLFLTNFSLHVSSDIYARYYNELANHYVFANALRSYAPAPIAAQQVRHYIAEDPAQDNQLVYVTQNLPNNEDKYRLQKCTGQKRRSAVALGVKA